MKKEFWRVVLFSATDAYCGSERFSAKWKAEQYIKEQLGRLPGCYAELSHWEMQSREIKKLEYRKEEIN